MVELTSAPSVIYHRARVVTVRNHLCESYPAVPATVPQARSVVADFAARAGASGKLLDSVRLAVSEAVTNAVVHAYRELPGEVQITAAIAADELWVLIADHGCGHLTPAATPGLGLGLMLMAEASDELVIAERADGGTEVRMQFVLPDEEP